MQVNRFILFKISNKNAFRGLLNDVNYLSRNSDLQLFSTPVRRPYLDFRRCCFTTFALVSFNRLPN